MSERDPEIDTDTADEAEADADTADDAETGAVERPRSSVRVLDDGGSTGSGGPVKVLLVALVLAVAAAGLLGWKWLDTRDDLQHQEDLTSAGQEAEDTARTMVTEMTTYSYKTKKFAWIEDYLLPDAADEFSANADAILAFVKKNRFVVTGTVVDLAHRVESETKVVVLAFVDQRFTRGKKDFGGDEQRVRLVMKRKGGEWKVGQVEILQGDNAQ